MEGQTQPAVHETTRRRKVTRYFQTKKRIQRAGKILLALGAILGAFSGGLRAAPKDYYFSSVNISVSIERDGSFIVDELRTFDFEGSFSAAWYTLPLSVERKGYRYDISLEEFTVRDESGQELPLAASSTGGIYKAEWNFRAADEQRTFRIRYRVRNGIFSYPDVSELYWQMIGEGWDRPTRSVAITVILPADAPHKEDILVYGHGPLSGWAEIVDARTGHFTATDLPAGQALEVRMVWPAGMVDGIPSSAHSRESIRKEEADFVQQTIDRARKAQEDAQQAQERSARQKKAFLTGVLIWAIWLIVGPLVWLLIYHHYWSQVGKDYRFPGLPEYFREPPSELRPALVEVLLHEGGAITPRSFTATLFDLARRGFLEFEDRSVEKSGIFGKKEKLQTTVTLKKDYSADQELVPYEKELLDLLFRTIISRSHAPGAELDMDELKDYLKKNPREFQTWYQSWLKNVRKEAAQLQFIEPQSLKARNIFLAATLPLGILTLNPLLVLVAAIFSPKLKRRAMPWARENELWKGLERFLDDFSSFEEVPPEAYKLWERYLVFGIIFGNAKTILKMLPVILQDERSAAPVWYAGFDRSGFAGTARIAGMVQHIGAMATSIQQASTSAAQYSSGGGGGFSGGGGGGGGGSGGGAR
jgi:uncharacterized membrane protein